MSEDFDRGTRRVRELGERRPELPYFHPVEGGLRGADPGKMTAKPRKRTTDN